MADVRGVSFWTFDDPRSYGARTIVSGLVDGLRALGCEVSVTPLDPDAPDSADQLRRGMEAACPDALLFVNQPSAVYLSQMGFTTEEVNALTIPRVVWVLDDPFLLGSDAFSPLDCVVAADPGFIPTLKARGAQDAAYIPVAASHLETGSKRDEFVSPVAYAGSVKDMSAWRAKLPVDLAAYFDIVSLHLEDPSQTFDALLAGNPIAEGKRVNLDGPLAYYLYVTANNLHRIQMLEALLPFGLRIFGNADWNSILAEDSGLRAVLHPPIHPERDLPDLAVSADVNLNLRSLQRFASPTQRDFILPGFGGFLISSARYAPEELERHCAPWWQDLESPTADKPASLAALVDLWLRQPEERAEWVAGRRDVIAARHTYRHRAEAILDLLHQRK